MVRRLVGIVSFAAAVSVAAGAAPAIAQPAGHPVIGLVQNANALVRFTTAAAGTVSARCQ